MSLPIQTGIRWGIIASLVGILLFIVPYVLGSTIIFSMWFGFLLLLSWLVFIILAARDLKQQQGGNATFKELAQATMVTFAIMALVGGAFNYIFYNIIDPTFADTLKMNIIENTHNMLQNFNVPEEDMEKAISELEKEDFSMSLTNILTSTGKSLLGGVLVSLIISAIMQRKALRT